MDSPQDYWQLKLELDVLAECSYDPLTMAEIVAAFTDEDGDSNTTEAELQTIVTRLVEHRMLAVHDRDGVTAWRMTPAGNHFFESSTED